VYSVISNHIEVFDYTKELLEYCEKNLILQNPDYFLAKKMGRYLGNVSKEIQLFEKRGNRLIIPFGVIKNIWDIISVSYTTDFAPNRKLLMTGDMKLYPYQEKSVKKLIINRNGILEAPCGSGKTQIGIALIQALKQKALWLTHTGDLLKQSMDRTKEYFDGDFGTITDGKVNIGNDITFATVQTMSNLDLSKYKHEWNVIIVDECHRVAGSPTKVMQFYKVLSNLSARHKYGLSATLQRSDQMIKSTYALLGNIVHKITDEDVDAKIIKSEHKTVYTSIADQIERYAEFDGTINYVRLINFISEHFVRNDLIIETLFNERFNYNLVLSDRVNQLTTLQKLAEKKGLKSEVVVGSVNKDKRAEIFESMRKGQLNVIFATYSLAKEGLDIPILNRLHLATPQKNKAVIVQSAGRIERRIEGKDSAIIYDYLDEYISYCVAMYKKRKVYLKRK
jgi:superfamily II DNA or RNA helicase